MVYSPWGCKGTWLSARIKDILMKHVSNRMVNSVLASTSQTCLTWEWFLGPVFHCSLNNLGKHFWKCYFKAAHFECILCRAQSPICRDHFDLNSTTENHFHLCFGNADRSQLWESNAYCCLCRKASWAEETQRCSHSFGTVRSGKLSSSLLLTPPQCTHTKSLFPICTLAIMKMKGTVGI